MSSRKLGKHGYILMNLDAIHLDAFSKSYSFLQEVLVRTKFIVETYFADIPIDT